LLSLHDGERGDDEAGATEPAPGPPPVPPTGDITGWIMRPVDELTDDDRAELERLCGLCDDLAGVAAMARVVETSPRRAFVTGTGRLPFGDGTRTTSSEWAPGLRAQTRCGSRSARTTSSSSGLGSRSTALSWSPTEPHR
jgi:hypothetical protein